MNSIDTKIRHVTKPRDNIFLDLGFSLAEAEHYLAESKRKIEEELKLKNRIGDVPESPEL